MGSSLRWVYGEGGKLVNPQGIVNFQTRAALNTPDSVSLKPATAQADFFSILLLNRPSNSA